jgi:hypothetical protein
MPPLMPLGGTELTDMLRPRSLALRPCAGHPWPARGATQLDAQTARACRSTPSTLPMEHESPAAYNMHGARQRGQVERLAPSESDDDAEASIAEKSMLMEPLKDGEVPSSPAAGADL